MDPGKSDILCGQEDDRVTVQVVSVLGSLAILAAYAANQFGWWQTASLRYSLLNALGAAVLTAVAAIERQWGFLLLEGVWTVVSVAALARIARQRPT
jgi:hypothetical protein